MPGIVGPMVAPQSAVQVTCDATATAVQLYVNGVATGSPVDPAGATEFLDRLEREIVGDPPP